MPLTNVRHDTDAKTVTLIAEIDATVERAWQLYADARQLEQWWNPPGFPSPSPTTTCPSAAWCVPT
jgi:uncharacterized protein YndB with AHSA1/START domain